ncbi:MAG TPA: flagellar hook-basal body complex protein FliE [Rhizomicrobium sp.]|jgi:flagellar hook-basal body complex protein FliE|nr:flagellar hook-basal body complex protein FliE [Rhizomicrobium sp.]
MAAIPSVAAAAYQAIAKMGAEAGAGAAAPGAQAANFGDFLTNAMQENVSTMKQGETAAIKGVAGKADIVDVVNAVNNAEITLDTVVAVRDRVIQAYQSIMQMPI